MIRDDLVYKFEKDVETKSWGYRLLLALDQLCNVIFMNGSQDETVSSHIGRRIENGRALWIERKICAMLQWLETSHCARSKGE